MTIFEFILFWTTNWITFDTTMLDACSSTAGALALMLNAVVLILFTHRRDR